jgi:hypothetical protein
MGEQKQPKYSIFLRSLARLPMAKSAPRYFEKESRKPRESRIAFNGFVLIRENSRLDSRPDLHRSVQICG